MTVTLPSRNLFEWVEQNYWVNPTYELATRVVANANADDFATATVLHSISSAPTAFWVDSKAKVHGGADTLEGALKDATRKLRSGIAFTQTPPLVVLVLYNLPNRACELEVRLFPPCAMRSSWFAPAHCTVTCPLATHDSACPHTSVVWCRDMLLLPAGSGMQLSYRP
jgi:hypothetical protein